MKKFIFIVLMPFLSFSMSTAVKQIISTHIRKKQVDWPVSLTSKCKIWGNNYCIYTKKSKNQVKCLCQKTQSKKYLEIERQMFGIDEDNLEFFE